MNKNYRIHTNTISDKILNVNMRQDFDFLEVLSLKLSQKDAYKLHSSNYGVIIGRVLANDAFGIPNAKVSVFIEKEDGDSTDIENIYPYSEVTSKDKEGRRYNLLPDSSDDDCYRIVGTFPNKRLVLDDNTYLEVYDKYWKYSTVTNNAGDYMLFAVPTGSHQIHVDIDLSDIGVLSQKPRDFMYKGYTMTLFDSSTQFKESTNLDNLTQIFSQNKSVFVYPFWGDAENGVAAITRADIQVNYKFEPTCVFMGSIMSDNEGNSINHKCAGDVESGFNRQLVAGEGTIEMIRKTQDGLVEEYQIQGNRLIDSDGVWCYQIPMNLDYIGTDEYGNIVPTDNPSKGIPTRTQVRFRISKTETGGEGFSTHTAKYLVPMNPVLYEESVIPQTEEMTGQDMEKMYLFGSNTPQSCFRDLYWNNVYSVKNFIPKTQVARRAWSPNYSALKASNAVENQNPVPFNKLTVHIPFGYMFICLLFTIIITIIKFINKFVIGLINLIISLLNILCSIKLPFIGRPFGFLCLDYVGCISMSAGLNSDNIAYYPGCDDRGMEAADCPDEMDGCHKSNDDDELLDKIQQSLSQEYDVIRLDMYQDWLNGALYMPLWFWKKSKKKKFLFFTIKRAENTFCDCDKEYSRLKTRYTCSMEYNNNSLGVNRNNVDIDENKWHKRKETFMYFRNGLIKGVQNNDGLTAYYYTAFQPAESNEDGIRDIKQRKQRFDIVRLFATDIILLGNLNESNIYGIPQLFNNLPSTTANIPPIATIEETDEGTEENTKYKETENDFTDSDNEVGTVITTGIDWGYRGADDSPAYKKGLFLDLECLTAYVRSKACINVERLSELGVSLDITYQMPYARGGELVRGIINSDGFINKFEIEDNNSRAMFATLNHIGFIPQEYQDVHEMYETQVEDENTTYLIPKFKYIYPVDFDGRLYPIMQEYENGFQQPLLDDADESYLTFRLGAEAGTAKDNSEGRIRHFYRVENGIYQTPLYNNSYYFYFGINKGNTAIDKFNSKFIAPCTRNLKKPFTIEHDTQGRVECPAMYEIDEYKRAFIKIDVEDIVIPFSYELTDSFNNLIVSENDVKTTSFRIPDTNSEVTSGVEITNQTYTIRITDGNGKTLSERIKVENPKVGINYEAEKLGTRFYNIETTRIDYICHDKNMLYGKIKLNSFELDGYEFLITSIDNSWYDSEKQVYKLILSGKNDLKENGQTLFETGETKVLIELGVVSNKTSSVDNQTTNGVKNCLCDVDNPIAIEQGAAGTMKIAGTLKNYWIGKEDVKEGTTTTNIIPVFYVYQPNVFNLTVTQYCNNEAITANSSSEIVTVLNGENFNAYLNDMPVRFMLGTINDNTAATIANNSMFYFSNVITSTTDKHIKGWYGVHQEDTYKFSPATNNNSMIWGDYVKMNTGINSLNTRRKILQFKFNTMFSLSEATYMTSKSSARFIYKATGGVGFALNRALSPRYDTLNNLTQYILTDRMSVYGNSNYPNIVGKNYEQCYNSPELPLFNEQIGGNDIQGNYFAVFSNNGGYVSAKKIDYDLPVLKQPSFAPVNPNNETKTLGKNVKNDLTHFPRAYNQDTTIPSLPYLRAMFVDRRLDFDLTLLSPALEANMRLYNKGDEMEKVWKGARISGFTYGGIELAYDNDDYTIISANTQYGEGELSGTVISASRNNGFEYSYSYDDNPLNDVKTYFNDVPDTPRRLYEAELYGQDIRDLFWSTNPRKKEKIEEKYLSPEGNFPGTPGLSYCFKYPKDQDGVYYNGDFIRDEIIQAGNYPTKRYIDVCKIASNGNAGLYLASCNYRMKASIDSDTGEITAKTLRGEPCEFDFSFQSPITMNTGEDDNYPNALYQKTGEDGEYYKFELKSLIVSFKLNKYTCEGFKIYNKGPRIIKVLPYTSNMDGISYYKSSVQVEGKDGNAPRTDSLVKALETVSIHDFWRINGDIDVSYFTPLCYFGPDLVGDTFSKLNVGYESDYHTKAGKKVDGNFLCSYASGDDKYLEADAKELTGITFVRYFSDEVISGLGLKVFAIVLEREFQTTSNDTLTKHINTVDVSCLYDVRHVLLKLDPDNTYVNMIKQGVDSQTSGTGQDTNTEVTGSGDIIVDEEGKMHVDIQIGEKTTENKPITAETKSSGQTFIQTVGFKLKFNPLLAPNDAQCELLADTSAISYKVKFTNSADKVYEITPEVDEQTKTGTTTVLDPNGNTKTITSVTEITVSLIAKWTEDMGIAADYDWNSGFRVAIIAKTRDNFMYKFAGKYSNEGFKVAFGPGGQTGGYNPDDKKSSGMNEEWEDKSQGKRKKYKTDLVFNE